MRAHASLAALVLLACGQSHSMVGAVDAAVATDASQACDPTLAPCTVTLHCTFDVHQGVDLATGHVTVLDPNAPIERTTPVDLACSVGRFLMLRSNETNADTETDDAGGLCPIGAPPSSSGLPRTQFGSLADVPSDEAACDCFGDDCWGVSLLCSINGGGELGPVCAGFGMLARDRERDVRYRVRIVDDGSEFITLEWLAVTP